MFATLILRQREARRHRTVRELETAAAETVVINDSTPEHPAA
jgi:hypothetical protein